MTTADGMEFGYDQLVIATGSAPADAPVEGSGAVPELLHDRRRRPARRRRQGRHPGPGPAAAGHPGRHRARPPARPKRCSAPAASGPSAPPSGPPPSFPPSPAPCCLPPAIVFEDGSSMNGDLVVLAEERIARDGLAATAGLSTAPGGGIVIGRDFRTSVPGIWAIGDAAAYDGVRLGLLVASGSAASAVRSQLLRAPWAAPRRPPEPAGARRRRRRRVARWSPDKPRPAAPTGPQAHEAWERTACVPGPPRKGPP